MDILSFFQQRKARLDELAEQRRQTRKDIRKATGRIRVKSRLDEVFDRGSTTKLFEDITTSDPLAFPGYAEKVEDLTRRSGYADAFNCAMGTIEGHAVVCAELVPEFLMGSMGTAVGEAICRAAEYAQVYSRPLIIFSASGGARMQEGMFSLMQMAKTSAAIRRLSDDGGLFISVLTHPTTGGVTASFASLGDIILAEPDALIGFAGPRVIEQTIGSKLPEGFQRSEFQQNHGFVDAIVARASLRATLAHLLELHENSILGVSADAREATQVMEMLQNDQRGASEKILHELREAQQRTEAVDGAQTPSKVTARLITAPASKKAPVQHVEIARNPRRPHAPFFIEQLFDGFFELHGDRLFGDDRALLGGIASFEGIPVTVAAHLKGSDLNDNIACNFGMPHPEGYRKFIRLAKQAEKFNRPLITLIDTPGAYPGAAAEERGQGEAIARCLFELSALKVPVISLVTGEGGSGGALALSVADHIIMLEYAVYSVLSPEGFASILWKDAKRATEACDVMKLTACDLYDFGMIDAIIKEPNDGAHLDPVAVIGSLRLALRDALRATRSLDTNTLLARRYAKYRKFS